MEKEKEVSTEDLKIENCELKLQILALQHVILKKELEILIKVRDSKKGK